MQRVRFLVFQSAIDVVFFKSRNLDKAEERLERKDLHYQDSIKIHKP